MNYYRRDAKRTLEVVTSEDTILLDLRSNIIQSLLTGHIIYNKPFEMGETYVRQMKYFIDTINSNKKTNNDFDYAASILRLAKNEEHEG